MRLFRIVGFLVILHILLLTNAWRSALAWRETGNGVLFAYPLAFSVQPGGLDVGYPNIPLVSANGGEIRYPYFEDFHVGIDGLSITPLVDDFSDWTVMAEWDHGALRATMGHGLPFVYFTTTGGEVEITFRLASHVTLTADGSASVLTQGRAYGIFAPVGTVWNVEGNTLRVLFAGSGYFSIAIMPDNAPEAFADFRASAFAFVTGRRVTWRYDGAASRVVTTFTAEVQVMEGTEDQPLLALYRHQWLNSDAINTTHTYVSQHGEMRVMRGKTFSTTMTYFSSLLEPRMPSPRRNTVQARRLP